jgi:putative ABC transport system permease protein
LKPDNLPRQENIALNLPVTLFALGLSLLSGILFGLAPAFQTAKSDIHSILRESGRSKTSGPRGNRIRAALVTTQVALSLILLISATLMIRTFENMRRLDLGFDPSNVLTLRVDYDSKVIRGGDTWRFYQRALEIVKSQPGVESASAANVMPFDPIGWTDDLAVDDNPNSAFTAIYNPIMPGYFHVMRIALIEGRDFTEGDNDTAAPVVIVDRRFAQKTWPGQSAIGKKLILHPQSTRSRTTLEVVGVANYTLSGIQPDARPQIYVPFGSDYGFFLMMAVRTNTDPAALASTLRHAIEGLGGRRPVWNIRPMNDYVAAAMAETRFALVLLGLLSGVALILAVIGVYAVVSYSIAERMHEFAIRIAVGAQARDILRLALAWGIAPTIAGVVIGITGAVLASRFLRAILFNVSATDSVSYLIASAMLLSAALLACYVPIRSLAFKADPKKFLG